jgi:glycosyltransferase involved in cell wall biosynthesis
MRSPAFSVVIPCYNVAATIEETIASVAAQTCADFEIVAVDNKSTDGTAAVLLQLSLAEPRLRVVSETVQGICAARNTGIGVARGAFIALLDGDDLFDPDYLESHARNLASGSVGVSYSRIRLVDRTGRPTGNVTNPPMSGLDAAALLCSNPCTSIVVVRREVFEKAGYFDPSLRRMEDQEWLFRVAAAGFAFRGIDRPIASYRISPGSLSHDIARMLEAHEQMLEAARLIAPELVARHGRLSTAAMLRYCARRALDFDTGDSGARGYLWRMLLTAPDLVLREPFATAKTIAAVLVPRLTGLIVRRSARLRTGDA